jgi:hypothetical protein
MRWTRRGYSFWRPITAIHEAEHEDNPETDADPAWLPLVARPPYPDHSSGLSAFGVAATRTLEDFYQLRIGPGRVTARVVGTAPPADVERALADELREAGASVPVSVELVDAIERDEQKAGKLQTVVVEC